MTVRIVRHRFPRPGDRRDEPHEEVLGFETVYQLEDRLIAVDPVDNVGYEGPRQFTRRHVIEVDFERLTLISYEEMVTVLPGEVESILTEDSDTSVELLS